MNKKIYIISVIIFLIDLISKILVMKYLDYGESLSIIPSFFSLTFVKNTGGAFSILSGQTMLLAIFGIFVLVFIGMFLRKYKVNNLLEGLAISGILGGLVGNLVDRIFRGGVVDFFDFNLFGYSFPVFNVADIFLVIGVLLLIIIEVKGEIDENRKRKCTS